MGEGREIASKGKETGFVDEFLSSAKHSLIDAPVQSLSQIAHQFSSPGSANQRKAAVEETAPPPEFNTSRWYAQQLGSVVGAIPWFVGLHYGGRGLTKLLVKGGAVGLTEEAAAMVFQGGKAEATLLNLPKLTLGSKSLAVSESAFAGLTYGGILQPLEDPSHDFWSSRAKNAFCSSLTFATLTKGTQFAKELGFLESKLSGTASGATRTFDALAERARGAGQAAFGGLLAGPLDATTHSLLNKGTLPTWSEVGQSTYTFAFLGASLGGLGPSSKAKSEVPTPLAKSEAPNPLAKAEAPNPLATSEAPNPPATSEASVALTKPEPNPVAKSDVALIKTEEPIPQAKSEPITEAKEKEMEPPAPVKSAVELLEDNAKSFAETQNWAEAAKAFKEAAELRAGEQQRVGDDAYVKTLTNKLSAGRSHWRLGEYEDAAKYVGEAKDMLEIWRCHPALSQVYATLADCSLNLGKPHEAAVFEGRAEALKANNPAAKAAEQPGILKDALQKTDETVQQSSHMKENDYMGEPLADGFVYDPNMLLGQDAPLIVVSPKIDPVLKSAIDLAESHFSKLKDEPHKALSALGQYAEKLLTPPHGQNVEAWYRDFNVNLPTDRAALLGDFVSANAGVCNARALLLKSFADRLGIPLTLRNGLIHHTRGGNEAHSFATYLDNGTTYIYDPGRAVYGEKLSERPEYTTSFMGNWADDPK